MANEKRLIDACALNRNIDCCDFESSQDYYTIAEQIVQAPTVDAVEVVHGRWITRNRQAEKMSQGDKLYTVIKNRCSECYHESDTCWNYCPNCGAKMDGGADRENS